MQDIPYQYISLDDPKLSEYPINQNFNVLNSNMNQIRGQLISTGVSDTWYTGDTIATKNYVDKEKNVNYKYSNYFLKNFKLITEEEFNKIYSSIDWEYISKSPNLNNNLIKKYIKYLNISQIIEYQVLDEETLEFLIKEFPQTNIETLKNLQLHVSEEFINRLKMAKELLK